jgi:hypothetical protein
VKKPASFEGEKIDMMARPGSPGDHVGLFRRRDLASVPQQRKETTMTVNVDDRKTEQQWREEMEASLPQSLDEAEKEHRQAFEKSLPKWRRAKERQMREGLELWLKRYPHNVLPIN